MEGGLVRVDVINGEIASHDLLETVGLVHGEGHALGKEGGKEGGREGG